MKIVERIAALLLLHAHIAKYWIDGVYVKRHGSVILSNCHQVHHAFGIQVSLVDLQRFDLDILQL